MEWNNTPYKVNFLEGDGFDYDDQVQNLNKERSEGYDHDGPGT